MYVWDTSETTGKPSANLFFANASLPPWMLTSRHLQDTILGKDLHEPIKVMAIEQFQNLLQVADAYRLNRLHVQTS